MPGSVFGIPYRPTSGQGVIWQETLGGRMDTGALGQAASGLSGLTLNRVPFGNSLGGLQDSGNLTFDGSTLTLTGALSVSGASSFAAATSVDIGTGARPSGASLSNTCATFFATDGQFPRIWGEAYGNTGLVISGRAIAGTRASPTATSAALTLFAITATGYDGVTYQTGGRAQYAMFAGSLWTNTNHETYHEWRCTPSGSTTNTTYMRLMGGGRLLVGSSLPTDDLATSVQVTGGIRASGNIRSLGGSVIADYSTGGSVGGAASTIETNANIVFWSSNYYYDGANDARARAGGASRLRMDTTTGATAGDIILQGAANGAADAAITYTTIATFKAAGHVVFNAGTTARPAINIPHGAAPTSPTDGDIWTTTAGLYVRINGATVGPLT